MTDTASAEYLRLLAESERYADQLDRSRLRPAPLSALAILTCMDARMVIEDIFGLRAGDANVIRNAGAIATDDVIRSLVVSQRVLGSNEVVVLGHTECGLLDLAESRLRSALELETNHSADWGFGAFNDLESHVRAQVARIRAHPWVASVPVHGLIFEVESGRVRAVA